MMPAASPILKTPENIYRRSFPSDLRGCVSGPAQRRDTESMTISYFYTADATFVTCGRCRSEGRMKTRLGAFSPADPRAAESNLFTL